MRRQNREINIFNMSMLDVICSALGAILILFIVTLQAQNKAEAKAEDFEKKYQKLEEKVQSTQDALQAKEQALSSTLTQLQQTAEQMKSQKQIIRQIASANAKLLAQIDPKDPKDPTDPTGPKDPDDTDPGAPSGMAIGMCTVNQAQITIKVFDHGSEDDDHIAVKLNKKFVTKDMAILNQPTAKQITLKKGVNYINIKALNEGNSSPNTATLVIDPCNNGRAESFIWEMDEGQERNISIVRK